MLLFSGSDGSRFEMSVVGYEFPEILGEEYDSNWLRISTHVVDQRGQWSSIDPCLLTWEVKELADWFEAIANRRQVQVEDTFVEPNLSFRLIERRGDAAYIAIYFEGASRPPWARSEAFPAGDLSVVFKLSESDLILGADKLRQKLVRYPVRGTK